MVYEFPKNMKLWEKYAEIRAEALREEGNFRRATEFYEAHRAEMDEGAKVSWEARYNRVKTSGRGRTVDEWKLKPEHHDNHWLDCLAGCAVCGSMLGCTLPEFGAVVLKKRGRIKLSERQGTHITTAEPRRKLKLSDIRRK